MTYLEGYGWSSNLEYFFDKPYYNLSNILNNHKFDGSKFNIHYIKRVSDGEIFTVGDETSIGIITEFKLVRYTQKISISTDLQPDFIEINQITKIRKALFTTLDGVYVYKGDNFSMTVLNKIQFEYLIRNMIKFSQHQKKQMSIF